MTEESRAAARAFEERSEHENTPEGRRIIELLWNPQEPAGSRGPKPKINLAQIVAAGVELADADGLATLSMRNVAKRLGVGAMSLYTYVPGKSELLELMIDSVYGEQTRPDPEQPWRPLVEALVRGNWRMYERHPWLMEYNVARMPLGPNVLDASEAMYAAFAKTGASPTDIVNATQVLERQTYAMARWMIFDAEDERRSGISTESFFIERGSFWFTYFDAERYPTMSRLYEAGVFDDEDTYAFEPALTRMLDSIELMITS